ncbi:DUF1579 domain-containing protein [bacterium]|nr:DUF1579 domain-containing protein [bacterium]MBU1072357.1 DUF1579 domain-containing protein [bacterium]MBU1675278.1 DUF1579 domain-containing protein [bacterium]
MTARMSCLVLCLMLILAVPAAAADEYDMEAMTAAWAAAATPGPVHAHLARMTGDWDIVATVWMEPGAAPTVSTSTSHGEMILGGRFLEERLRGEAMGMPFEGRGLTGYDNTTHTVTAIWIDTMGTVISVLTGVYEKIGEPLELCGSMVDPVSGQEFGIRTVTTFVGDDGQRMDYFMTMPGADEMKSMELVYTRK